MSELSDTAPLLAVRADPDLAHEALAQLLTKTIDVVDRLDEARGTE